MHRFNYLIIILIFGIYSCKPQVKSIQTEKESVQSPTKEVDADLGTLYQHYHTNPKNQFQKDENKIIDFASTNNIPVKRSPTGLYYYIDKQGAGPYMDRSHQIFVHYKGMHLDGSLFDSSYKRDKPIDFKIGQMIAGWNEAMKYMQKGDSAVLLIPSYLAYDSVGLANYVEPNEVLHFEMKIVDAKVNKY